MWNKLVEICSSPSYLIPMIVTADWMVAISYYLIPIAMLWIYKDCSKDLPYPSVWICFLLFILACGTGHIVHAVSFGLEYEYLQIHAIVRVITGVISFATAVILIVLLPEIRSLPSPWTLKNELEEQVEERTREKTALIHEINHRVGNTLQNISSMVSVELREADDPKVKEVLIRLRGYLHQFNEQHRISSLRDYDDEVQVRLARTILNPKKDVS